jgi:hypothetical protein
MDRPRILVDFNEVLERDLALLSREDTRIDSSGASVMLLSGKRVYLYMEDRDGNGAVDNLIADGMVERNPGEGWGSGAKWCCRIDEHGIRHESEVRRPRGPETGL